MEWRASSYCWQLVTFLVVALQRADCSLDAVPYLWKGDGAEGIKRTTCTSAQLLAATSLKKPLTDAGTISDLGKVADIEVCGLLCCEITTCDLALLEADNRCHGVTCRSKESCEGALLPNQPRSTVLEINRVSGNDVWSQGSKGKSATIVTKQASVQKSLIPETVSLTEEKGSFITLSNKDKIESPMEALLRKESTRIHEKQMKKDFPNSSGKKESIPKAAGEKIQDVTEHYLKSPEKIDMTVLQENDTMPSHNNKLALHNHRRDLRHTLISPITIGAFTCMAVIAVSGFAMAIIKYKKERREFEDKQTQKP